MDSNRDIWPLNHKARKQSLAHFSIPGSLDTDFRALRKDNKVGTILISQGKLFHQTELLQKRSVLESLPAPHMAFG